MLKLIQNHKLSFESGMSDEAGANPSHQFIEELIAQVKYAHLDEVWEARLKDLTEDSFSAKSSSSKRKHLKIL